MSSRYCCQSISQTDRCVSVDSSVRPKIECNPFKPLQFCWPHAAVVHSRSSTVSDNVSGNGKHTVRILSESTNGSVTKINCTESGSLSSILKTSAIARSWYGCSSLVALKSHSPARIRSTGAVWCLLAAVNTTDGWINEPDPLYNKVSLRELWFNFRRIATVHGNSPKNKLIHFTPHLIHPSYWISHFQWLII